MSLIGRPTDCKTITIVTRPAEGILAAPMDATVAVKLIIIYSTKVKDLSFIWAINIGATASYKAVPSMFMVLPTGRTNLVTLESILRFSSKHLKVTGKVAELDDVPKPVITAFN